MSLIQQFMTEHHRACDETLVDAEAPLANNDWQTFSQVWHKFTGEMEQHFQAEEDVLFPQFEQATGMTAGPTMVMRDEHKQIRAMFAQMLDAVESKDKERAAGIIESLMLFIQQHNMKEEQILYPMSDVHLTAPEQVIDSMSKVIDSKV